MTRLWLLTLGGGLALLGCSSSSDIDYKFGAADMEQVVVGTWSGMWGGPKPDGGTNDAAAGDADVGDADLGDAGASDGGTGLVPFTLRIEHLARKSAHPLCDPRQFSSRDNS